MYRVLIGVAVAGLMAGVAAAETIKVGDLGSMPSRRVCMSIAKEVLESYISEYGGHSTSGNAEDNDSWTFYAWDLRPGDNDVVISCPVVGDQVNAFYMLHASGSDDASESDIVADRIRELWDRLY